MRMSIPPPTNAFSLVILPLSLTKMACYPYLKIPKRLIIPKTLQHAKLCDAFNHGYTELLHMLHNTFNGQPHTLRMSITKMHELSDLAFKLVTIDVGDGKKAGTEFRVHSKVNKVGPKHPCLDQM